MKRMWMSIILSLAMVPFGFASGNSADQNKAESRLKDAASVVQELTQNSPDQGIPQNIRDGAKCVAVVPGLTKAAFGIGGRWGDGVATCRTSNGWSAPAFFTLTGGSVGAQLGVEKTDLVMMIMNNEGMNQLLKGKVKIGADASASAGPVGREASGSVGYDAAILTYSKSKGAFAGASIDGAVVQADDNLMNSLYPNHVTFTQALKGQVAPPQGAQPFLSAVRNASSNNNSNQSASK